MSQQEAARGLAGITVTQPGWLLSERGLFLASLVISVAAYIAVRNFLNAAGGRQLIAGGENQISAAASGIDPVRSRMLAFVLSSALTGVAGVLYLYHVQTITPGAFPLDLSVAFLAMITIGGSGTLGGSLLGAAIIGLLPELLRVLPGTIGGVDIQQNVNALYALLLLAALRFFPDGVWPPMHALCERVFRSTASLHSEP
jgi:ABC-type branched-subunit amino acid transport system permease subunit